MAVVELNSNNFEETIKNGKVLVDFNADWCGPCRMMAPTLEELSEETSGVIFASLNVDDNDELAEKYGVSSIPCLVLFENGEEKKRSIGLISKEDLSELVNE